MKPAPMSPAEAVRLHLEQKKWTQAALTDVLERPAQYVSSLCNGKAGITRQSAAQLGAAFGTTPEYWLDIQNAYELWKLENDPAHQRKLAGIRKRAREDSW